MKAEDNPVLFSEVIETVRDANKQIEDEESGNGGSSDFNMVQETGELRDEEKERKTPHDRKDWKETRDDWLNNSQMVKHYQVNIRIGLVRIYEMNY